MWLAAHRTASVSGLASPSTSPSPAPSHSTPAGSPDGAPPYYVVIDHGQPDVEVRASATGDPLSTAQLPHASQITPAATRVTADGNDRTFVIAETWGLTAQLYTQFYLLHVSGGGRSAQITSSPVPPLSAPEELDGMAASPDGRELAITIEQNNTPNAGSVEIVSMATGAIQRTWSTGNNGQPLAVSWADGDSELGVWNLETPGTGDSGLWVLNTTAPATTLAAGRLVLPKITANGTIYQAALLTPGGTTAIAQINETSDGATGVVVVSLSTKAITQVLYTKMLATGDGLLAIDPTGNYLLVQGEMSGFGRLDGSTFTPLPLPADNDGSAYSAAW